MVAEGRISHTNWDQYDTRHVVFKPSKLSVEALELGYWQAYRDFYRWDSIWRGAGTKETAAGKLRHLAYAGGWKKFEPVWDWVIRLRRLPFMLPLLETVLSGGSRQTASQMRAVDFNLKKLP